MTEKSQLADRFRVEENDVESKRAQISGDLGFSKFLRVVINEEDANYPRLYDSRGMRAVNKYISSVENVKHGKVVTALMETGEQWMYQEVKNVDTDEIRNLVRSAIISKNQVVRETLGFNETYRSDTWKAKVIKGRIKTYTFNYVDAFSEIIDVNKRSLFTSVYWCGFKHISNNDLLYQPLLEIAEVKSDMELSSGIVGHIIDKIELLRTLKTAGLL